MPLSECTRACASLAQALNIIDSISSSSFVVGGFVRDSLLGREVKDIDVIVPGDPFNTAQSVAHQLGGSFVPLDQKHCIARVVLTSRKAQEAVGTTHVPDTLIIDFAGYQESVEADMARRDFTIDAMAMPVSAVARQLADRGSMPCDSAELVIDPLGGLRDLADRRIRACRPTAFEADSGRLLRAVRLARELTFTIDTATESLIREHAHRVSAVAAERTREELLRLLALPHAAESIRYMDSLGLLAATLPELEACRDVEQPTCHFWDVLEHSIETVATYEFVVGESNWRYGNEEMLELVPNDPAYEMYLAAPLSLESTRSALIKLACLLHDIAKPQTKTLEDSGRARFLGHSREGSNVAKEMLQRLRFSALETTFVETLVYQHLRPVQMATEGMPTRRAVYRFFRDTASAGIGVLYVAMADYLACRGPLFIMSEWRFMCELVQYILQEHNRQQSTLAPVRLVDGSELMRALGLRPGPTVGLLLETIREAQAAGSINSKEDALTLARRTIESEHFTVRTSK